MNKSQDKHNLQTPVAPRLFQVTSNAFYVNKVTSFLRVADQVHSTTPVVQGYSASLRMGLEDRRTNIALIR